MVRNIGPTLTSTASMVLGVESNRGMLGRVLNGIVGSRFWILFFGNPNTTPNQDSMIMMAFLGGSWAKLSGIEGLIGEKG